MSEPRYADSITFTVEQLDETIACLDYAINRCAGCTKLTADEASRVQNQRREIRAMLDRFARAAKRRGRRRL